MKIKAAVAFEAAKPLVIEELELGGPKAGEVLVRLVATGVCHTDAPPCCQASRWKRRAQP